MMASQASTLAEQTTPKAVQLSARAQAVFLVLGLGVLGVSSLVHGSGNGLLLPFRTDVHIRLRLTIRSLSDALD